MSKKIIKKKKIPLLYKLFAILLTIIATFLISSIIYLNVLNILLLILVLSLIIVFSILSIFLMFKTKIKKIGLILSIILILIFSILSIYIGKTNGLLTSLNLTYKTYNYSVVVLNNSSYNNLKDIKNLELGYYDDGSIESDKALKKVSKKIEIESISYENTHILSNALLDEEVDAILIENSYLDILNENINIENNIKNIYKFKIVTNTSDIAKDINVVKKPFNIYLSGIDTYGSISSVSRSDVNMIISVNPTTRQILLTSIPRDYYVQLHGKSGYRDKLTHAGLYGTDMSIQTLEDLFDCDINYYVKVNFSSVIDIIDAIGGIEVYSNYAFTSIDNYSYVKGYNKVNGEEALSFARERKAFTSGDRQRVINQQAVFKAIFDKCTSKEIITKYTKVLDSLIGSFVTNMPTSRITSLVKMQLSKNYSWNIETNCLTGNDSSNYTYSTPLLKSYVMIPDEESVIMAKDLINKVTNGTSLDEEISYVSNMDDDNLKVKLIRDSVTLIKGNDYIYHGYSATYKGVDITGDTKIKEVFSINGKSFNDYRELVRYITYNLDVGEYIINYKITYKDETKTLKQKVIINEMD